MQRNAMKIDKFLNDKYTYLTELIKEASELVNPEKFPKYRLNMLDKIHVGFIELVLIEKAIDKQIPIEPIADMTRILSVENCEKIGWDATIKQLDRLIKHQKKREGVQDCTVQFSDEGFDTGCLLYIVYEKGLYLKLYGELNSKLLAEASKATNLYKEKLEYYSKGWGEIVDIRHWNLLTSDSLLSGKENNKLAESRNKEFTIYVMKDTNIDKYIVNNLLSDATNYSDYKFTLSETISMMNENRFDLGDIIDLDYVGHLKFIEDEK